ncbi:MAG: two-component system response regulator [Bacteriovoracaceae bacterium]|jgi:two-component system response regulator
MKEQIKKVRIVVAEDDDDDYEFTLRAFTKLNLRNEVHRVLNGKELLDYIYCEGNYSERDESDEAQPHLILLDLNMPLMDGREALAKIKSDPRSKNLVVVVLTTSSEEEDKLGSYNLGVNSFIRKPVKFQDFLEIITTIQKYWIEIVELP